jgi:hypothetical protein
MKPKTKKKIALSPAKLAANRANALKSTGPRTPEGRRRSAANTRVTHGFRTHEPKLSDIALAEIAELEIHLTAHWQPATPETAALVHEIAAASWRMDEILMTIDEALLNPSLNPMPTAALDRYLATAQATRRRARKALQANLHARTQTAQPDRPDSHDRSQTEQPNTPDSHERSQTGQPDTPDLHARTQTTRSDTPDSHARTQTTQPDTPDSHARTQTTQPNSQDSHGRTQTTQHKAPDSHGRTQTHTWTSSTSSSPSISWTSSTTLTRERPRETTIGEHIPIQK